VSCVKDGMVVLVSGPTAWAALCDFNGRSKWANPKYRLQMIPEALLREGTQMVCDMGFGEALLFVGKLNRPCDLTMLGTIGGIQVRVCYKITEILDGSYVEVCMELEHESSLEELQLACYREWAVDQLATIKKRAELAPRTRQ